MDFDVSAAVTAIGATVAGLGLLGAALLTPNVVKKGWQIIRGGVK